MDKPIYVKITTANALTWYKDAMFIGATYKVINEEYRVYRVEAGFSTGLINKIDCEVVPTLQPENKLPEGQHLISTHQLKELHTNIGTIYDTQAKGNLERWFPTVFVPAKTYQAGDRFVCNDYNEPFILATPEKSTACLISLSNGNRYHTPMEVGNVYEITEQEFNKLTNGKSELFTLLPDTTDQMV